jgi:hypothetical protein
MPGLPHCTHCHNEMPKSASICPHCGRPGLYPNVRAAEDADEVTALEQRYLAAFGDATARGADTALREFEDGVKRSKAVLARTANELQRLAASDNQIYATYYDLLKAGVISHVEDRWSLRRALADEAMFHGYKERIRFAALTLDMRGLSNYGDCFIVLRTDMIAHRASVFEENSTLFMRHHRILMDEADNLPRGYRATWDDRGRLCAAKLAREIDAHTPKDEYSKVLLRQGATTADDEFVEVHIWGPMTARTFEQVSVKTRSRRAHRVVAGALKENLGKLSVKLQVN